MPEFLHYQPSVAKKLKPNQKLAPIVQSTTAVFGLPYHVQLTFLQALRKHAEMLKKLGRE
jgi:hypothetical protein